jgi:hypothetical protein
VIITLFEGFLYGVFGFKYIFFGFKDTNRWNIQLIFSAGDLVKEALGKVVDRVRIVGE